MRIKIEIILLIIILFLPANNASSAALTFVSDTISSSIPGASSNHTIKFKITTQIPANGKIIIKPEVNAFKIPTLLSVLDVDMSINGVQQTLVSFSSPTFIRAEIVTGTSGSIMFTLPASLAVGSEVVIRVGKNANTGGVGTKQIRNPFNVGSYRVVIDTRTPIGVPIDNASAMIATLFPVRTGTLSSIPISKEKDATFEPNSEATTILTNIDNTQFKVTTPAGIVLFDDEILLHIFAFDKADTETIAPTLTGKSQIGKAYELTMTRLSDETIVTEFSENVTFDMYYNDSDVSGIDENSLKINKWGGTEWLPVVGSTVFPSENKVFAQVSSFSLYTIIGDVSESSSNNNTTSSGGSGSSGGNQVLSPTVNQQTSTEVTTINNTNTLKTFPQRILKNIKDTFNNLIGKNDTISNKSVNKQVVEESLFDIFSSPAQSNEKNKSIKIAFIFVLELLALLILVYFWKRFRK